MMDFLEQFSSAEITLGLGLLTGLVFGAFAQQSRFCLRAATVEFWRGKAGDRFSIWLFTFATALLLTQLLIYFQLLERTSVRQLSTVGSMSGAIIGGSLFGIGMIMARGCASRLLVLSATGNLRALVAGLVVTVVSQAALRGVLSPAREEISTWWTVQSSTRDLANYLPDAVPILMALALLVAAVLLARKHGVKQWHKLGAVMVGAAVAMGWGLTAWHASFSFDIVPVKSVSFTGPAADTLMGLINMPTIPLSFDIGIVSGVFAGSFFAAWLSGEFKIQSFNEQTGLSRYLIGAVLMGFGGMLAGGCAVGAGVSGGAVMASTAWIALLSMWISAGLTDRVLDYRPESASTAVPQAAR